MTESEPAPEGPTVDQAFRDDLKALAVLIGQLHDLEDPSVHVAYDQSAGHPSSTPAGSRLSATELLDKAHVNIATIARILNIPGPENPDHLNQADWRTDVRYTRIAADHPALAADSTEMRLFAQEIHWIVAKARELTNPPDSPSVILGPCPNPQCGKVLRGDPHDTTATCPRCRSTWQTDTIRSYNYHRLERTGGGRTCTATQGSRILKACGIAVSSATIRAWKQRGTITPTGTDPRGQPTYALADILGHATKRRK